MKATYTLSEDLYVHACMLPLRLRQKKIFLILGILFLLLSAAPFAVHLAKQAPLTPFPDSLRLALLAAGGTLGGAIGQIATYLLSPWRLRKQYRKYKAVHEPCTLELKDEGLFFSRENGSLLLRWEDVHKVLQDEKVLLLYPAPHIFYVIPKTVQEHHFPLSIIDERLRQQPKS